MDRSVSVAADTVDAVQPAVEVDNMALLRPFTWCLGLITFVYVCWTGYLKATGAPPPPLPLPAGCTSAADAAGADAAGAGAGGAGADGAGASGATGAFGVDPPPPPCGAERRFFAAFLMCVLIAASFLFLMQVPISLYPS